MAPSIEGSSQRKRNKGVNKSIPKTTNLREEHIHHDIYFKNKALYERLVSVVDKLIADGKSGASISSVVCLALEKALPHIEKAKVTVKPIQIDEDMANIHVWRMRQTYYITVRNMAVGAKLQVGGDWFHKDSTGKTAKKYPRILIERIGSEAKIEEFK